MNVEESLEYCEFETKYRIDAHLLIEFKKVVESINEKKSFIYVEGPDKYYIRDNDLEGSFARYRKPSYGLDNGRTEVTFKLKPPGAKNNIKRTEYNWRVDGTPEETIHKSLIDLGWKFNFSIWKSCQIYKLKDATLVFYTVYDTTDGKATKSDSFLEIEVHEENMKHLTEKEAFGIIEYYEKLLFPLGINAQKRMRKSLFEMFRR
jgi:hypothetical protein